MDEILGIVIGFALDLVAALILASSVLLAVHSFSVVTVAYAFFLFGIWYRWVTVYSLRLKEYNNSRD